MTQADPPLNASSPPVPPVPPVPTALPVLPSAPRRRWVTVLLFLVVFVAGGVVGSGVTLRVAVRRIQHAIKHPEEAPGKMSRILRPKLGLSEDQTEQVRQIIARHQQSLQQARRELQPLLEQEFTQTTREITGVLTPEQKPKWEKMVHNFREDWLPPAPPAPTN